MAKKKAKKQNRINRPAAANIQPSPDEPVSATSGGLYALREMIESVVIAFVLAFLFRTFEAEAFVIPTGSMSPALQGRHKDVDCSECGYRFRATASSEGDATLLLEARLRNAALGSPERQFLKKDIASLQVVTGMCPMCRQTMAMRPDLPSEVPDFVNQDGVELETSYLGDRILVNKYCYNNRDPDRWDVIVFKFPGNGDMNYIKRLVGLPNEILRIYQGDIFIRDNSPQGDFQIERKPADKVSAMLQPVHDTSYDPSILFNAGWPLRWQNSASSQATAPGSWQVEAKANNKNVQQKYHIDPAPEGQQAPIAWLQYRHHVPRDRDWAVVREFQATGKYGSLSKELWLDNAQPELIRDFNPYNTGRLRGGSRVNKYNARSNFPVGILDPGQSWKTPEENYGLNWVGDLALECEVEVKKTQGELTLDLVEAGKHFTCQINLKSGQAVVGVEGFSQLSTTAKTHVHSAGTYQFRFANVDDQLLLWIDDNLVNLSETRAGFPYEADQVFEGRKNAIPTSDESDLGDLAPARIGARNASVAIHRLQVLRDIYYIATNHNQSHPKCDYPLPTSERIEQMFADPDVWSDFLERRSVDFPVKDKQLFVMGDNSPASSDCRLWYTPNRGTHPGGPYLDRRLLIGKAVCVFWPHSWGSVPGASALPGFPGFGDMRLVR